MAIQFDDGVVFKIMLIRYWEKYSKRQWRAVERGSFGIDHEKFQEYFLIVNDDTVTFHLILRNCSHLHAHQVYLWSKVRVDYSKWI